jgi:hypothetical protein
VSSKAQDRLAWLVLLAVQIALMWALLNRWR